MDITSCQMLKEGMKLSLSCTNTLLLPPRLLFMIFSCALQDYCLNRQPDHFRNTLFLVDKFHWFGHTACSRTYNLTQYPAYAGLNSQIAEQFNSALARIKCSVSQMTQRTFMFSVRFFLQMQNEKKIASLKQYSEHSHQLMLSDVMQKDICPFINLCSLHACIWAMQRMT